VFGSRRQVYPRNMDFSEVNSRLYERMFQLDRDLEAYEAVWFSSYFLELKKVLKFQKHSGDLRCGDVVLVKDKISKNTKQPVLAIITCVLSDRTYEVEYNKTEMKINEKTFEIIKSSTKNRFLRPAQQLIYITSGDDPKEVHLDPFIVAPDNMEENVGDTPDEQNDVLDEFYQSENEQNAADKPSLNVQIPDNVDKIVDI